ncbi:Tad domain-containing protein [Arthrobacter sp. I2-34]|uniref:Tad domain-containing protein n=1 Tax=Arthrobacter hankyongi TaxID=2904801 RepID=A0ABS9L565_9MICC|nr:Tad domain-containing protein [Arthrobacter hankyongi]MCG2621614.1 Tad domain-containing protein [Arthrobacter hankyongi]
MRRLKQSEDTERGSSAILVALLMTVLLGFAALAVDVGAMYWEKAQLQNGADAAALAIAEDCANGSCGDTFGTAQALSNGNARDNVSGVRSITFPAAKTVRVVTNARDAGGSDTFSTYFARIFGVNSVDIEASATAVWEGIGSGPAVFPIIFKRCEFEESIINGTWQVLDFHGSAGCDNHNPSGQNFPGAFGWLDQQSGQCKSLNMSIGNWAGGDTGVAFPGGCDAVIAQWKADLQAGKQVYIVLPIYDNGRGTGGNVEYHVSGYVTFEINGWRFTGGRNYNNGSCTGSCQGFIGRYIDESTSDGDFGGGGPDLGATIVRLTE